MDMDNSMSIRNRGVLFLLNTIFLLASPLSWPNSPGIPFTIVPITNTTLTLPSNVTATVSYTVTNSSGGQVTLMMQGISGVTQTTTGAGVCSNPFTLNDGASCRLNLVITGSTLPQAGISDGPVVCQQGADGQPSKFMCNRPANQAACLNITLASAAILGQSLGGGTIACLGGAPFFNLIAATTDNSLGILWGRVGLATNPPATSLDDGAKNTAYIVGTVGEEIPNAATICSGYNGGGYNDWFLPAQNQLRCLCANQLVLGGFGVAFYWSSTEFDADQAVFVDLGTCDQFGEFKDNALGVRCVRALSL